jgi:hypothetical protein
LLAGAAAVNSGVTAVTFFGMLLQSMCYYELNNLFLGIREFAISPLLVYTLSWPQYARRKRELGIENPSDEALQIPDQLSWSDLRKHKTLDTGMSGVLAGGLLRGWKCTWF